MPELRMERHAKPDNLKRALAEQRWPTLYEHGDRTTIPVTIRITWADNT